MKIIITADERSRIVKTSWEVAERKLGERSFQQKNQLMKGEIGSHFVSAFWKQRHSGEAPIISALRTFAVVGVLHTRRTPLQEQPVSVMHLSKLCWIIISQFLKMSKSFLNLNKNCLYTKAEAGVSLNVVFLSQIVSITYGKRNNTIVCNV